MDYNFSHNYPRIARESGFKLFQKHDGALDWRLLSSLEIDKILKEQNFECIEKVVNHIAEAPLGQLLNSHVLDSGIAKYFGLAQLSLQYLLFCKKFLDETVASFRDSMQNLQVENMQLKELERENNEELLHLHKKLQRTETINKVVYPCTVCTKNFVSNEMLNTHIQRKHSGNIQSHRKSSEENDRKLIDTIKLELEIKHLKERLNVAEREIRDRSYRSVMEEKLACQKCEKTNILMPSPSCSSIAVQSNVHTHSIGIQNNLDESKEKDENEEDSERSNSRKEILEEVRQKIIQLENWREKERIENNKAAGEIKEKLSQVANALEERKSVESELLAKDSTTESDEKLQEKTQQILKTCNESMLNLFKESEKKINYTLRLMQVTYEDKLNSIENLLEKFNTDLARKNETDVKTPKLPPSGQKYLAEEQHIKPVNITVNKASVSGLQRFDSIETLTEEEYSMSESGSELRSESEMLKDDKIAFPKIVQVTSTSQQSEGNQKISKEVIEKNSARKIIRNTRNDVWKLVKTRLSSIGVDSHATNLPSKHMRDVSSLLAQQRNEGKRKFKSFFVTRNKLKFLVDALAKERLQGGASKPMKKKTQDVPKEVPPLKIESAIAVDTKGGGEPLANDIESKETPISEKLGENLQFRATLNSRLERILESPVRKLKFAADLPTEAERSPAIKPMPAPRKKVMFDFQQQQPTKQFELQKQHIESDSDSLFSN